MEITTIQGFKVDIYDLLLKRADLEREMGKIDQTIAAKQVEIKKLKAQGKV